jgi:hypothetical protein
MKTKFSVKKYSQDLTESLSVMNDFSVYNHISERIILKDETSVLPTMNFTYLQLN